MSSEVLKRVTTIEMSLGAANAAHAGVAHCLAAFANLPPEKKTNPELTEYVIYLLEARTVLQQAMIAAALAPDTDSSANVWPETIEPKEA